MVFRLKNSSALMPLLLLACVIGFFISPLLVSVPEVVDLSAIVDQQGRGRIPVKNGSLFPVYVRLQGASCSCLRLNRASIWMAPFSTYEFEVEALPDRNGFFKSTSQIVFSSLYVRRLSKVSYTTEVVVSPRQLIFFPDGDDVANINVYGNIDSVAILSSPDFCEVSGPQTEGRTAVLRCELRSSRMVASNVGEIEILSKIGNREFRHRLTIKAFR